MLPAEKKRGGGGEREEREFGEPPRHFRPSAPPSPPEIEEEKKELLQLQRNAKIPRRTTETGTPPHRTSVKTIQRNPFLRFDCI